jgi:hypothetical protein
MYKILPFWQLSFFQVQINFLLKNRPKNSEANYFRIIIANMTCKLTILRTTSLERNSHSPNKYTNFRLG